MLKINRHHRTWGRFLVVPVLTVLLLSGCITNGESSLQDAKFEAALPTTGPHAVTKIVDGDTIWVDMDGQRAKIRFIGMDTPETEHPQKKVECFGREATMRAKELMEGKQVHLAADPTQGDKDRYQRLLRYVYLADGTMVNEVMIADGYAHEYTYRIPYRYQDRFKALQREAQEQKKGLWGPACP